MAGAGSTGGQRTGSAPELRGLQQGQGPELDQGAEVDPRSLLNTKLSFRNLFTLGPHPPEI